MDLHQLRVFQSAVKSGGFTRASEQLHLSQSTVSQGWLASASYLGNETTHLWITEEVDPAEYLGTAACTIAGVSYKTCSSTSNTNQRRLLYLANPALGKYYASIDTMDDGAVSHYEAMLLSIQHRMAHNFVFNANYTDSYCVSDYDFGAALATPANSQPFNRHAD
ncbi:MAG: LysR family transcriptional regulator [Bryobacteraceae bacterium]